MEQAEKIKNRIGVQTLTGIILLSTDDILYFQYSPNQHRWLLRLTTGESHKLKGTTSSKMIVEMSPDFRQINQNCIINLIYLRSVENQTLKCQFLPPHLEVVLVMSQRYYASLKGLLRFI